MQTAVDGNAHTNTMKKSESLEENDFIVKQNCNQCNFSCENFRDLKEHTRRINCQKCEKCEFVIYSEEHRKKHMLIKHDGEDGALWVADSIMSNVDFKFLSAELRMKIKHVKAYTATHDDNARFPSRNFLEVVDVELKKGSFQILVIEGGSVDISNLDTCSNPEQGIPALREEAIKSANKLFNIAEAALHDHPALRKVILMKRAPRYDPLEKDPLNLKPQLSSLADSISFGLWCESKFRDRIILGGQRIPRGREEHCDVFGVPGSNSFDGIHMRGPSGFSFLTENMQKVLSEANLIKRRTEPSSQYGTKDNPPESMKKLEPKKVPHGRKPYDAMGMMLERIRSVSTANLEPNTVKQANDHYDDVFIQPHGRNEDTRRSTQNKVHVSQPSRTSVIKKMKDTRTSAQEINLQEYYNIPVSNHFSQLLN